MKSEKIELFRIKILHISEEDRIQCSGLVVISVINSRLSNEAVWSTYKIRRPKLFKYS